MINNHGKKMQITMDSIDDLDFIMTLIRPFINIDEWSDKARNFSKDEFLCFVDKPRSAKDTKRIAEQLQHRGYRIHWPTMLKAYAALMKEYAEWHFANTHKQPS